MRHIFAILVVALLFSQSSALAEIKEIIAEGAYNMGDGETPTVAESRALLQAKRTAVEEAGTYVESYSKTKNFQLTADEIQVLASGVMEVDILEKKRTVVGDGFNFWVKIKARVSTDKMEEMAKRVKEKSVVEDYKKIQEAYDKSQKEIEELKRQLAGAKSDADKKQVGARIADDERLFRANVWFEKGYRHDTKKEYDYAIEAYTSAIALDPNFTGAYINRGAAYYELGDKRRAIADYDRAIELDTKYAAAYNNRGYAYYELGDNMRAIADYNRAIELDPKCKAAYNNRGNAYSDLGDKKRAIADYDRAIELDPKDADTYNNRGLTYFELGNNKRAIADYDRAIELNPVDVRAYNNRAGAYFALGDRERGLADSKAAARLGYKGAQDWLRSQGIKW